MKFVKDIMTKEVITSNPEEKLSKTIAKMEKYGIKEIPVVKNNKLIGMVTFFDALDLIKYPESKVSNVIVSSPSVSLNDRIEDVIPLMVKTGFEALPVVENDEVVGIISEYDILKEYKNSDILKGFKVKNLAIKTKVHLSPDDKIGKARRIMRTERIDRIPIMEKQKLVGMVLLIDILRTIAKPQKKVRMGNRVGDISKVLDLPVKNVMRKNIPLLEEEISVKEALEKLLKYNLKGSLVVDRNQKFEGIFYRFEILKIISQKLIKEGVWVRFPSCELHPDMVQILKEKIAKKLRKLKALMPELEEIIVRIKTVHGKTSDHIYEINLKFLGPGLNKNVKVVGYNALYAIEDGLDKIQKQLDKKRRKYP